MSKKYVIQWKSKGNGRVGKGSKVFGREEAQRLAEELNHEYPDIEHQIMDATHQGGGRIVQPGAEPSEPEAEAESNPSRVLSFQE